VFWETKAPEGLVFFIIKATPNLTMAFIARGNHLFPHFSLREEKIQAGRSGV